MTAMSVQETADKKNLLRLVTPAFAVACQFITIAIVKMALDIP